MIHVRCSRLPLLFSCSPSAAPGISVETPDTEPADMGSGVHAVLNRWIPKRGIDPDDIFDTAARYRLDADELGKQARIAWAAWKKAERFFPGAVVGDRQLSYESDGVRLTGTPDIYCPPEAIEGGRELRLADLKTGFTGRPAEQITGYSFLLAQQYPLAERVYRCEIRTREQSIDSPSWHTRAQLDEWWHGLVQRVKDTTYRPGRHCANCPRGATCEAKTALLQQSVDMILGSRSADLENVTHGRSGELTEAEACDLYDRAKLVEKAIAGLLEQLRAAVSKSGPLAFGDGERQLQITQQERREIVFPEALEVLTKAIGADKLAAIMRVSNGDLANAIRAGVGRGHKGAAVDAVYEQLAEAGALRFTTIEKLEAKRLNKQLEVSTNG